MGAIISLFQSCLRKPQKKKSCWNLLPETSLCLPDTGVTCIDTLAYVYVLLKPNSPDFINEFNRKKEEVKLRANLDLISCMQGPIILHIYDITSNEGTSQYPVYKIDADVEWCLEHKPNKLKYTNNIFQVALNDTFKSSFIRVHACAPINEALDLI